MNVPEGELHDTIESNEPNNGKFGIQYLCPCFPLTGVSLANHLAVKSVLLSNHDLVSEYSTIKENLARQQFDSIGYYGIGKNDILKKILEKSDLSQEMMEAIRKVNVMPDLPLALPAGKTRDVGTEMAKGTGTI